MKIEDGHAIFRQAAEDAQHVAFCQLHGLKEAESPVIPLQTALLQLPATASGKPAEQEIIPDLAQRMIGGERQRRNNRLAHQAKIRYVILCRKLDQNICQSRMQIQVMMAIQVTQRAY